MSPVLQKVTTEFIAAEDRIRLAGQAEDGRQAVLWLTRRMLSFLLPILLKQLDTQFALTAPEHRDALQEFAQQAARETLGKSEPVSAGEQAENMVVTAVDVGQMENGTLLTFRDAGDASFRMPLGGDALRQWLHILYHADRKANWQLPNWPAWLTGENAIEFDLNAAWH